MSVHWAVVPEVYLSLLVFPVYGVAPRSPPAPHRHRRHSMSTPIYLCPSESVRFRSRVHVRAGDRHCFLRRNGQGVVYEVAVAHAAPQSAAESHVPHSLVTVCFSSASSFVPHQWSFVSQIAGLAEGSFLPPPAPVTKLRSPLA